MDLLLVQSKGFIAKVGTLSGSVPLIYYPNFFVDQTSEKMFSKTHFAGFDCAFPVLFAGNIGKAQAVDIILEAASLLQGSEDVRIIMVGDGSRRNWMMQESVTRGLRNIVFLGQFQVEEMPSLMDQAAALMVTLADDEILNLTVPSKIQAYLAAGRPIIGCLNGAGSDIIKEAKAGFVVPSGDAIGLANLISYVYKLSQEERLVIGSNGRRFYKENFSSDKLIDTLIKYINQAVLLHQRKQL
jgi:glycosyltransferase involved in cell wall biosynthesis